MSKNNGSTIETLDERYQDLIGESIKLSFKDIKLANIMYQCSCKCSKLANIMYQCSCKCSKLTKLANIMYQCSCKCSKLAKLANIMYQCSCKFLCAILDIEGVLLRSAVGMTHVLKKGL